jgi:hypothetical protein
MCMTQSQPKLGSLFALEFPQTVGTYSTYDEAQKAVDFLAERQFPVQNLCIVGTDLRSIERVTGRKTWGTVIAAGARQGITSAAMVALFVWFLIPNADMISSIALLMAIGVALSVLFSVLGYAISRGRRDYTSVTQTIATKYEVLSEHKVAATAREALAVMPGARAALFDPRNAPPVQRFPAPGGGQWPSGGYPTPPYPQGGASSGPPEPTSAGAHGGQGYLPGGVYPQPPYPVDAAGSSTDGQYPPQVGQSGETWGAASGPAPFGPVQGSSAPSAAGDFLPSPSAPAQGDSAPSTGEAPFAPESGLTQNPFARPRADDDRGASDG